jgi:hypothetical protein
MSEEKSRFLHPDCPLKPSFGDLCPEIDCAARSHTDKYTTDTPLEAGPAITSHWLLFANSQLGGANF